MGLVGEVDGVTDGIILTHFVHKVRGRLAAAINVAPDA